MANRSTFNRTLPRAIIKESVGGTPAEYKKRQLVVEIDPITKATRPDADGVARKVMRVLPDYDRMYRLLMKDAHDHYRKYKNGKLDKAIVADLAKQETETPAVAAA